MRPPADAQIHVPELPPKMDWVNVAFLRMAPLLERESVLIEFFDTARIHSVRTLDYVRAWHARYGDLGLRVLGVHSPGYSFGRDPAVAERAIHALGIEHAVVLDPELAIWRLFGNQGWPARYLFGRDGILRYAHYGEGDYLDAERAIQETLREHEPALDLPEPLAPVRPEDEPGVLLAPPTADVALPAGRDRLELVRDWVDGEDYVEAADAGAAATVTFDAGEAWAVLSGGTLEPGLHPTQGTVVADDPGVRLHGFQFVVRPPDA